MAVAIAAVTMTAGGASQAATYNERTLSPAPSSRPAIREGFRPESAGFLSASTGFLVGGVNCAPGKRCPARLASTTDGGGRWRVTAIPGDTIAQAGQVLFASKQIGWVYGLGKLLATRDGGRQPSTHT